VQEDHKFEQFAYDDIKRWARPRPLFVASILLTQDYSHFLRWVMFNSNKSEEEPWSSRHMACVAVAQAHVASVLKGPKATVFDASGMGWVRLIPEHEDNTYTGVGVSYLVPRVFTLLQIGWENIVAGSTGIFAT
jgi:hypothetical protein